MNIIQINMGDISGDGHNQRDSYVIQSSLNKAEIVQCLAKVDEELGGGVLSYSYGCCTSLMPCSDYEDGEIPEELWEKILERGILSDEFVAGIHKEGNDFSYDFERFINLWLDLVRYGAKLLGLEVEIGRLGCENIDIGGYGLYG